MIASTKRYIPVLTLSIKDNNQISRKLEAMLQNNNISWNKYRSETATQPKNNNLD